VQFVGLASKLKPTDPRFKGLTDVDCYKDGNLWKYTVGASTDFEEMVVLRRQVAKLFPEAFIVAFRHGERIDINEAREEYYKKKK
jgi:N-acetylmuramoyl-L-alanine amidase